MAAVQSSSAQRRRDLVVFHLGPSSRLKSNPGRGEFRVDGGRPDGNATLTDNLDPLGCIHPSRGTVGVRSKLTNRMATLIPCETPCPEWGGEGRQSVMYYPSGIPPSLTCSRLPVRRPPLQLRPIGSRSPPTRFYVFTRLLQSCGRQSTGTVPGTCGPCPPHARTHS